MNYLLLFVFLIFSSANAQTVAFKEIKLKPNSKFYNINNITIIYPIIVTKSKQINKLINDKIKEEILDTEDDKISTSSALNDRISDGLINLSYDVTFKKYGILSMKIYAEGCGAHCSSWNTFFNFDLKTGRVLSITDLIFENKIDSFQKLVFNDKEKALKKYKKEETDNFEKNEIDSVTYNWVIEQVNNNCIKNVQIETFSLSNQGIEIIDLCEFPNVFKSQEPEYELKYSYKFMHPFFKPKFQRLLVK